MQWKFGVCEWVMPVQGPDIFRLAQEAGLSGVELDLRDENEPCSLHRPQVRKEYMRSAAQHNIQFGGIQTDGYRGLALADGSALPLVKERMKHAVAIAAEMGIGIMQLPFFFSNSIKGEEKRRNAIEYLQYTCDLALKHSITIGCENDLSAEDNLTLIQEISRPNYTVYFDTANPVLFSHLDAADMIPKLRHHICQVHIKDGGNNPSCDPLGQGKTCFYQSVSALRAISFDGWLMLENNYTKPLTHCCDGDMVTFLKQDAQTMIRAFTQDV